MALPEFSKIIQDKTTTPDWAKYMRENDYISYAPTYRSKMYFELFDKYVFPCEQTGDMVYYVYDPVKHGAASDKKYPVLTWLHGASNGLDGVKCIMCCGAEQYASEKYQKAMGGAYIIVPIANESRSENGNIEGTWFTLKEDKNVYSAPVKAIIDKVISDNHDNISKKFIMGASSGGYFTWQLLEDFNGFFDGAIPISSGYIPTDEILDAIEASGIKLIVAHGRHDEMADFDECVKPREDKLKNMDNCICFFPEWVYNGDGGISSVHFGIEMGQHCMINWIQADLIFDNGVPADIRLPEGVTGWIRKIAQD